MDYRRNVDFAAPHKEGTVQGAEEPMIVASDSISKMRNASKIHQKSDAMWNPPPNVTEHKGDPLAPDSDFFADPPPDIGPIRTAHTSLKQGKRPKSAVMRLAIALVCGAALEILLLALDRVADFLGPLLGETGPPVALVLLPIALLAAFIALLATRFRHTCSYVGEQGLAHFTCKRGRANIRRDWLFHFKNATSLMTSLTEHYKNSAYTHTSFGFFWYSSPFAKSVFGLKNLHTSLSGNPPPGDLYHFCRSAESAWYHQLVTLMEAELAQKGRVSFYTGHNGWTALGPGFIEIRDSHGKVTQFIAAEIGSASILNHVLEIARPGVQFSPLDFASHPPNLFRWGLKQEGVYRFDLTAHNAPMFRYFFKRCLGVGI
jgi:hypothetical protein